MTFKSGNKTAVTQHWPPRINFF